MSKQSKKELMKKLGEAEWNVTRLEKTNSELNRSLDRNREELNLLYTENDRIRKERDHLQRLVSDMRIAFHDYKSLLEKVEIEASAEGDKGP